MKIFAPLTRWWQNLFAPTRPEKLLFTPNRLSSLLMMVFLMFNTYYLITFANAVTIDWRIILIILSNLALSLSVFLTSSKIKYYRESANFVLAGLLIYQVVRYFFLFTFFNRPRLDLIMINGLGILLLAAALYVSIALISLRQQAKARMEGEKA